MPIASTLLMDRRAARTRSYAAACVLACVLASCGEEGGEVASGGQDAGGEGNNAPGGDAGGVDGGDGGGGGVGLSYEADVLPILTRHACTACHGPGLQQGNHRLDSLEALLTSGVNAPAVVACDAMGSPLVQKLRVATVPFGGLMPQGGPEIPDADVAVIAQWINEGAGGPACAEEDADAGGVPEVPPTLVEERVFRVSARVEMTTGRLELSASGRGGSPLFAVPGESFYGVIGAGSRVLRAQRSGELELLPPAWDDDAPVGEVLSALELPDGQLLVSTETGLLFFSDGQLWPSPVSSVLEVVVTSMVSERVFDAEGRTGLWLATPRGLYVLLGDRLERLTPDGVAAGAGVDALVLGRSPAQPEENALWVAYGSRLFAVRPDTSGAMVYRFELDFEGPIRHLAAVNEELWVATDTRVYHRRPGALVGRSRWVSWALPSGQAARGLTATSDGAVWLLTGEVLYRTVDQETWEVAVGAPTTDVVALHPGDQGSLWLTRPEVVSWVSPGPTLAVSGLKPGASLSFFPDLELFPSPSAGVSSVEVQVDSCAPVVLTEAPWVLTGGSAGWADCLGPGSHALVARAQYGGGGESLVSVPFAWESRSEPITWHGHIEPMVYGRYCARPGCHASGFAPDSAATWEEKIIQVLDRTDPATTIGRMPPNGPRLNEVERLLILWWREDGFLP